MENSKKELIDIVDENNNITGTSERREIVHEKKLWHRHVLCWIMNENGKVLMQKRASTRKEKPNIWGKVGGHVAAGETVEDAIQREIKEEVGLEISKKDLELIDISKIKTEKDCFFAYDYLALVNYKINEYKIQIEEISEVKYFTIEELEQAIKTKDPRFIFKWRNTEILLKQCEVLKQKRQEIRCLK